MKKALIFVVCVLLANISFSETIPSKRLIAYQLSITEEMLGFISGLFDKFSEGYMTADEALDKLAVWQNEYDKSVQPVDLEGADLDELMNKLFSRMEWYFAHYKKVDRENPFINLKIVKTKFDIAQEVSRLRYYT